MANADTGEIRLHHIETGHHDGIPLLLVHGWGGDACSWAPVVAALTPGTYRVIVADLRGHGHSPAPAAGYRPADLAADLARLAQRLDLGPFVAVGHSMGAQVVTVLAVTRPEVVRALVVVDPAYAADEQEEILIPGRLAALRAEGAQAAARQLGALPPDVLAQLLATPRHVLAQCYAGMYAGPDAFGVRPATARYLARRRCPVLCLRSVAEAARWEAAIPGDPRSEIVTWKGCGHFLHRERPRDFARLLDRWLPKALWS
ncbi:alpha/beta fold hydrolase [Nonomuraea insulae]|uniref:Alpha/beta fold hydrolase n=1 Tax=Nonomuraea insulae TaxID=1616787 RepID=A0ABW1D0A0_9ACTN